MPLHSARNRDLRVHRDYLEATFLVDAFPRWGRSVRPSNDAVRYLIDQVSSLLSEAPIGFRREGGECVAALAEGHLSRTSVVTAFARLRCKSS